MSNSPSIAMEAPTAAEICARFTLSPEARELLREEMTPEEFLTTLMAKRQYVAAIEFLAHAMPPRAGIWWGCLCLQHACGALLSPPDYAALQAATVWVVWPTEAYRAHAQGLGQAAGVACAAGLLALAAGAVGASGPAPMSPATAVANAVKLATTKADPARIADTQRLYVELGSGVAKRRFTWPVA